jgi:hypothetical protein
MLWFYFIPAVFICLFLLLEARKFETITVFDLLVAAGMIFVPFLNLVIACAVVVMGAGNFLDRHKDRVVWRRKR